MTQTRVTLNTAALIAAAGVAGWLLQTLWSLGIYLVESASGELIGNVFDGLNFWSVLGSVLRWAAFGLGVYLTLRFVRSIDRQTPWRVTIKRAILAGVGGAVVETVLTLAVTLIGSVTVSRYPFVDLVQPGLNLNALQYGLISAVEGLLPILVTGLPLAVLGCVLLRVWLENHPVADATVPASRAETLVDH